MLFDKFDFLLKQLNFNICFFSTEQKDAEDVLYEVLECHQIFLKYCVFKKYMPYKTLVLGREQKDISTTKCITLMNNSNGFISSSDAHGTGLRKKKCRGTNALGSLFVKFLQLYSTCLHTLTHSEEEKLNK